MLFYHGPKWAVTLLICICVTKVAHCISLKGQTVELNGAGYYIPPKVLTTLRLHDSSSIAHLTDPLYPITVINGLRLNSSLDEIVKAYQSSDDVFNVGFLEVIVFQGHSKSTVQSLHIAKAQYGTKAIIAYSESVLDATLPPGPYFWSPASGAVNAAYRLYSDEQGAFTEGLIPAENSSYDVIPAAVPGAGSITIGVPSRLYFTRDPSKPLAGARIGVKDIFDIAGIKRSCGSRAYYHLYPPAIKTAPAVQKLLDAGAVLIGKMKTSQFANGEWATADWVDYHAPFNPRGDGYQDPGSSSSGPAAGVASYDWIDLALGTDTGGSIRGPAGANGVYGNRPSHGSASLEGIMPLSPVMDTVGILTRDANLWKQASRVLYSSPETNFSLPRKLYTIDFPTTISDEADEILLGFAKSLAGLLNTTAEPFDIEELWNSTAPNEIHGTSLGDFVGHIFPMLTTKEQFQLLGREFYSEYKKENSGRLPFVDPSPLLRWDWGMQQPDTAMKQAFQNLSIFTDWWHSHGYLSGSAACSDSIVIYPGSTGDTSYRNGPYPIDAPDIPGGFGIDRIPSFVGSPDFAVPIGESEYNSTITNRTEALPVVVDIMAAKGCDGMLFNLIERLVTAGVLPNKIHTGRFLYNSSEVYLAKGKPLSGL